MNLSTNITQMKNNISTSINNIKNRLEERVNLNKNDVEEWRFIIDYIEENFKNIEYKFIIGNAQFNRLVNINRALIQISVYLDGVNNNNNNHIYSSLSEILEYIQLLPSLNTNSEKILEMVNIAYERSDNYIKNLEKEVNNLDNTLKNLYNKTISLEKRNNQLEKENRELITKLKEKFSDFKDEKNKIFDDFKESLRVKFEQTDNKNEEKISKRIESYNKRIDKLYQDKNIKLENLYKAKDTSLKQLIDNKNKLFNEQLTKNKESAENILKEMNLKKEEIESLVNIITNTGIASRYKDIAEKDNKYSFRMRMFSILLMILAAGVLFYLFKDFKKDINIITLIMKATMASLFLLPAFYLSKIASEHKKIANNALKMELELTALTPYLDSLPKEEANKLKTELAFKFFGNNEKEEELFANKDIKKIIMEIIETANKKK